MIETVAFVAIGRNEGPRLDACLQSLRRIGAGRIVYVDSGSTDDSRTIASAAGAEVVELNLDVPFTAARARNAGAAQLKATPPTFVQFIDGDCTLVDGWLASAVAFLTSRPDVAVVCGRRRERNPQASVYNRLCDIEWNTPTGEAAACGGDALIRFDAFQQIGGYRDSLIAGEEPELCVRLREKGWRIWRLDKEMTLHDAAMTRFGQWWRRSVRAGHAFAEVSSLHARSPKRIWTGLARRAVVWSMIAPVAMALATFVHPALLGVAAAYPAQVGRLAFRARKSLGSFALPWAFFTTVSKFAETQGVLQRALSRAAGRSTSLIEYK